MFRKLVVMLSIVLGWGVRRRLLILLFNYKIHPEAWIGFSWVFPECLVMGEGARIGNFNVCKGLYRLELGKFATVGRGNWITGYPLGGGHFLHQQDRQPILLIGEHSAVTNRHLIDCTSAVVIGRFSIVAGFRSQILTHSIDLVESRQSSLPISIGDYCFVGTSSVLLGGATLPNYSVLGAMSLLNKKYENESMLYAGVPARPVKENSRDNKYFHRVVGRVG